MQPRNHLEELFTDHRLMNEALKYAAQRAIWESKQLGFPITVWRDGKMVTLSPEEIVVEKPIPNFPYPAKGTK